MPTTLAEAFVKVRPDASLFGPELRRAVGGQARAAGKVAGHEFEQGAESAHVTIPIHPDTRGLAAKLRAELRSVNPPSLKAKVDVDSNSVRAARSEANQTERSFRRLRGSFVDIINPTHAFAGALRLVKLPALVAGANAAVGVVGALAVGTTSAVAALTPLVGLLPAAGVAASAFGQAQIVLGLATSGVGKALKAQAQGGAAYEKALAQLTPAARQFVIELDPMRRRLDALKQTAASNLFPGVIQGLREANPLFNTFDPLVASTARTLGGLATQAGRLLGSPLFRRDFTTIGNANVHIIQNMGSAALILGRSLVSVLAAASPLAVRLSRYILDIANAIARWVDDTRRTGQMAAFFERTEITVRKLALAAGRFGHAFGPIFREASVAGRGFLDILVRGATQFDRWTHSAKGAAAIKKVFGEAKPVLHSLSGLVASIAKNFEGFGAGFTGGGLAHIIDIVADKAVPAFAQFAKNTGGQFLENLVQLGSNLLRIFSTVGGNSGTLTSFVGSMATLSGWVAKLIEQHPGFGGFLAKVTALVAIGQSTGLTGLVSGFASFVFHARQVSQLTAATNALTVATTGAEVAQKRSVATTILAKIWQGAVAVATKVWAAAQWVLNAALSANPIGIIIVAIIALVAGIIYAYNHSETFRKIVQGAWKGIQVAVSFAWNNVIKPALVALAHFFVNVVAPAALWLWHNVIEPAWVGIRAAFTVAWPIIKAVFEGIRFWIQNVTIPVILFFWHNIVEPAWAGIKIAFQIARVVIEGVFNAIRGMVQNAINTFNFFRNTVPAIFGAVTGAIRNAWNAISNTIGAVVSHIVTWVAARWEQMRANIAAVWNGIAGFFGTVFSAISNTIGSWVSHIVSWVAARWEQMRAFIAAIWNGIAGFFGTVWSAISNTFGAWVSHIVGWVAARWEQMRAFIAAIWNGIAGFFGTVWAGISNTFGAWLSHIVSWVAARWEQMRQLIAAVWNGIAGFFGNVWAGISNTFGGWVDRIRGFLAGRWEDIRKTIAGVWNGIVGYFGNVWKQIANHAANGINWVIGIINKGVDIVNKVLGALGVSFKLEKLGNVAGPGKAHGGRIYGPGTDTSDSIPVRLSNNEYVIRAQSAKSIGYSQLDWMNRYGAVPHGYAGGGRVGANNNALLEHHRNHVHVAMSGPNMSYPQIIAAAKRSHIPFVVGSTYRPGSRGEGGGLDHHSEGKAVDFPGFNQDALAGYFERLAGVIELIHRTDRRDYAIFGGSGGGGILTGIFKFLSKGWNWVLDHMLKPAGNKAIGLLPEKTGFQALGKGWMKAMFNQVVKKAKVEFDDAKKAMDSGSGGGGGAARWTGVAAAALNMLGLPGSWLGPLLTLIGRESGGNPRAINLTDSNAQRGDPSRGLMQTIGSTFRAYALPGFNKDIYDPLSNILAGLRYIKARYGSIFNVQQAVGSTPRGYDNGGQLPPGLTTVWNGTGRPENVSSSDKMDEVIEMLERVVEAVDRVAPGVGREMGNASAGLKGLHRRYG